MPIFALRRSILLAALAALPLLSADYSRANETALDRYVAAPDPSYKFSLIGRLEGNPVTAYVLDMTSQSWRKPSEVDRTEWKHWLTIYRPATMKTSIGLLFISGGSNGRKPPEKPDDILKKIASDTGSAVAELRMVPNQPLTFAGNPGRARSEDALIAYTWDKYLTTGDDTWPARLPMTKSAVRAMDTVTAFLGSEEGGKTKVDRFVVAGGSKRGWTTWATAAVDRRVIAIAPIVIDMLNIEKSFIHHYRAYGYWAPSINDYFEMGLMDKMGDPKYHSLMKIEEPYEYRPRFTMPKLILNSSGDQFFLPDSSQFYYDDLPGEKYLRYVPNTDHSLRNSDAWETLTAFYESILFSTPRPKFSWDFAQDGSVRVTSTSGTPSTVRLWQATNPDRRDFRLEMIGPAYRQTELKPVKPGVYEVKVAPPEKGWTAYFVELTYPASGAYPFKFSTPVKVIPDTYPYPPPEKGKTIVGPKPPKRG